MRYTVENGFVVGKRSSNGGNNDRAQLKVGTVAVKVMTMSISFKQL